MDVECVTSDRGRAHFVINGYVYEKESSKTAESGTETIYARCIKQRRDGCRGRVIIGKSNSSYFIKSPCADDLHTHQQMLNYINVKRIKNSMKARVLQHPTRPVKHSYDEIVQELSSSHAKQDKILALPTFGHVSASLYRKRGKLKRPDRRNLGFTNTEPAKCQGNEHDTSQVRTSSSDRINKGMENNNPTDRKKQQQEAAASSVPTDEFSAGPSNASTHYEMKDNRRFVNVTFFVKSLQNLNNHGGDGCNFSDMHISGETKNEWNAGIELSCTICLTTVVVWMEDPDDKLVNTQPLPAPPTSARTTTKKLPLIAEKAPAKKRKVTNQNTPALPPDPPVQQNFMAPPPQANPILVPHSNIPHQDRTYNPSYSINRPFMMPPPANPLLVSQSNPCHQNWTGNPLHTIHPHFMRPPPLGNPLLVPQSNAPHQDWRDYPSHSVNQHFINQTSFFKQEIALPEDAASPSINRVPSSSTQPAAVQLLFCVEPSQNSNSMPRSVKESDTFNPGGALANYQTSSMLGLGSGLTSENETIVPEITPAEVLPVDLNLVKEEIEDEFQSMEVSDIPSVRLVPMSETSLNRSETLFASESSTETEIPKDSSPAKMRSVMASTKTYATLSDTKLLASVTDTPGAKDSTVSSYSTSVIPQTVFQQVIPGSKEDVLRQTADGK